MASDESSTVLVLGTSDEAVSSLIVEVESLLGAGDSPTSEVRASRL